MNKTSRKYKKAFLETSVPNSAVGSVKLDLRLTAIRLDKCQSLMNTGFQQFSTVLRVQQKQKGLRKTQQAGPIRIVLEMH